jgi:hypothetical protein
MNRRVYLGITRSQEISAGRRGQFEIASGPGIIDTMVTLGVEDQTMDESPSLIQEAIQRWQSQQ